MPTFAKLLAALGLAAVAFLASQRIMRIMPEGTDFGAFVMVNVSIGLVAGWTVIGRRAGRGHVAGISNAVTGVAVLVFWGIVVQAVNEMVRLAMRNRYRSPFEAAEDVLRLTLEFGQVLLDGPLIALLLIGAVLIGFVVELWAGQTW